MPSRRVFTGQHVFLDGALQPATLLVDLDSGKIERVLHAYYSLPADRRAVFTDVDGADWVDSGDKYIIPGLVDAHVHLNEPGRTEWEGFWTGTRAAASGGVTTVVDMPLNSIPPTTTVAHLEQKRAAARGQCWTDVAFWGGVIPGNQAHLRPLINAGVKGFKCFLIESGVDEFPCVNEADLELAMTELEATSKPTVLCFHAELDTHEHAPPTGDPTSYDTFLASRPESLECAALALITRLHAAHPTLRLHIVHLSAASGLPLVRAAQEAGRALTVETCFHYLCLSAEDVPRGRPEWKCCPPVRGEANRAALWDAVMDGTVGCVVSDHSPCVAGLKRLEEGNVMEAWGGISTLGLGLSLLWTEGRRRGVEGLLARIVGWCAEATARHAGVEERKGALKVGWDADMVVWDPEAEFTVTKEMLNFKNKLTPYEGMTLRGRVEKTYLRGRLVYDRAAGGGGFDGLEPVGQLL